MQGLLTNHAWFVGDRECMKIDNAVKNVISVLSRHPIGECPKIVTEVD
jgi:hypothetical protein